MTSFNTKSGEILSLLLAVGIATGMVLTEDNPLLQYIKNDCIAWLYIAYAYSVFGFLALVSAKFRCVSRFLSGVCWGTLVLFMVDFGKPYPLLFIATILFGFDIFIVATKGNRNGKATTNHK